MSAPSRKPAGGRYLRRRLINLLALVALASVVVCGQEAQRADSPPGEVRSEDLSLGAPAVEIDLPSEMKVGQTERVRVRIASTMTSNTPPPHKDRPWESYSSLWSETFAVDLSGEGFQITGMDLGVKTVRPGGSAQWDWDVTPGAVGRYRLSVGIRRGGGGTVQRYDREVVVERNWLYIASKFASFSYLGLIALVALTMLAMIRNPERLGIRPQSLLGRLLNFISVYLLWREGRS